MTAPSALETRRGREPRLSADGIAGAVIEARELRKRYGELTAVDGVTFEVAAGEIFGLLGPNGAGKTTTIEILEGLLKPDGGEARVLGLDVTRESGALKERIGVQLQTVALYPELTVVEVIGLFRSFYQKSLPTKQLVEWLDLSERQGARTKELSGGQRQRLSVALALVNDPELVFLDEPTTGLDPQARRSLWDLVSTLRAQGKSVILTTHYMEEAEQLCDRIGIMDHGRILEMGTVDELVTRRFKERSVRFDAIPALTHDRLGSLAGVSRVVEEDGSVALYTGDVAATIGALLEVAESLGVEPANLTIRRATLEDVFLDLTGRALRD
jgi:ABC-2 type transport system ATP-binding protein